MLFRGARNRDEGRFKVVASESKCSRCQPDVGRLTVAVVLNVVVVMNYGIVTFQNENRVIVNYDRSS